MPIKSLGTITGLQTTDEKQDLSSGTFVCHVPVTSCDPNTSIRLPALFVLKHRKFEASGKNRHMFPHLVSIPISSKYCSYRISTFSKVSNLRADWADGEGISGHSEQRMSPSPAHRTLPPSAFMIWIDVLRFCVLLWEPDILTKEYAQQQQGQQRWVAAVSRAPTPNGP